MGPKRSSSHNNYSCFVALYKIIVTTTTHSTLPTHRITHYHTTTRRTRTRTREGVLVVLLVFERCCYFRRGKSMRQGGSLFG